MKSQKEITLIDYAGHPFTVDLARHLHIAGIPTTYSYCSSNSTPHGDSEELAELGARVVPIALKGTFRKVNPLGRLVDETKYAFKTVKSLNQYVSRRSHLVACQMPLISALILWAFARARRVPFTLWLQDIQSDIVAARSRLLARIARQLEHFLIANADSVICISTQFKTYVRQVGRVGPTTVLENWAPLDKIPVCERNNSWSNAIGLATDSFRIVYSGTMGIKHRPNDIIRLSEALLEDSNTEIILVAEGAGADEVRRCTSLMNCSRFYVLELQPLATLPLVLGSADLVLASLDPSANEACVPSKILSYLAAGRPVVALMDPTNPSADLVVRVGAGWALRDVDAALERIRQLRCSGDRLRAGERGRAYAERHFDGLTQATAFLKAIEFGPMMASTEPACRI